ncbi:hypothetical protein HYU11_04920 [Candidatus Woesearchaeota archaeon]|nr:hypothetical protein [Candidatus Woesearchaeota archaeon]
MPIDNIIYTPPRQLIIAGIPALVADPHNEVYPFWHHHVPKNTGINAIIEKLRGRVAGAILIEIDSHTDTCPYAPPIEKTSAKSVEEYASKNLRIHDFIPPAFHYGLIGVMYYINPEKDGILAYGRVTSNKLRWKNNTIVEPGIKWSGDLIHEKISYNQCFRDLEGYKGKIVVDIDLDAFELAGRCEKPKLTAREKIDKVVKILQSLPRPTIITIARSQTPELYVPSGKVDALEAGVIAALDDIYSTENIRITAA